MHCTNGKLISKQVKKLIATFCLEITRIGLIGFKYDTKVICLLKYKLTLFCPSDSLRQADQYNTSCNQNLQQSYQFKFKGINSIKHFQTNIKFLSTFIFLGYKLRWTYNPKLKNIYF